MRYLCPSFAISPSNSLPISEGMNGTRKAELGGKKWFLYWHLFQKLKDQGSNKIWLSKPFEVKCEQIWRVFFNAGKSGKKRLLTPFLLPVDEFAFLSFLFVFACNTFMVVSFYSLQSLFQIKRRLNKVQQCLNRVGWKSIYAASPTTLTHTTECMEKGLKLACLPRCCVSITAKGNLSQ